MAFIIVNLVLIGLALLLVLAVYGAIVVAMRAADSVLKGMDATLSEWWHEGTPR